MGSWEKLYEGKNLAILAVGSMVHPALGAAFELEKEGIQTEVISARFVKPLDEQMLDLLFSRFDKIITVEENALSGGFGSAVLEFAESRNINNVSIKRMGIPDRFIEHGSRGQLLADLGLDREGIIQTARKILKSEVARQKVKTRKASL
jgi:1-deoxy-D-xylulose-5-phosphate synthase